MRARTAMVFSLLGLIGEAAGQACRNQEPGWGAANMQVQVENTCDGIAVDETGSHECESGFTGGSIVCSGQAAESSADSADSSV